MVQPQCASVRVFIQLNTTAHSGHVVLSHPEQLVLVLPVGLGKGKGLGMFMFVRTAVLAEFQMNTIAQSCPFMLTIVPVCYYSIGASLHCDITDCCYSYKPLIRRDKGVTLYPTL